MQKTPLEVTHQNLTNILRHLMDDLRFTTGEIDRIVSGILRSLRIEEMDRVSAETKFKLKPEEKP